MKTKKKRPHSLLLYPKDKEILRKISEPVTEFVDISSNHTRRCIDAMRLVLQKHRGAGLAAIQIGWPLRIIMIKLPSGKTYTMCNPEIIRVGESHNEEPKKVISYEMCLSVRDTCRRVERYLNIGVRWQTQYGNTLEEIFTDRTGAAIIQHEVDHLDGKLMIDHPEPLCGNFF